MVWGLPVSPSLDKEHRHSVRLRAHIILASNIAESSLTIPKVRDGRKAVSEIGKPMKSYESLPSGYVKIAINKMTMFSGLSHYKHVIFQSYIKLPEGKP